MGEQGKQRGERAKSGGENNKERQLLLGVHGDLVERRQELAVGAFRAGRIRVEQVAPLERVRKHPESPLPGAVQKVQGALDVLPVRKVEERVRDGFGVAALQDVLRRQDQRLHLEKILRYVRIELDGPVDGLDRRHFGGRQPTLARDVRGKLVRDHPRFQQRRRVTDRGRFRQRDVVVFGQHRLHVRVRLHLEQGLDEILVYVQHVHDRRNFFGEIAEHLHRLLQLAQFSRAHRQPPLYVDQHVGVAPMLRLHQGALVLHLLRLSVAGLGVLKRLLEDFFDFRYRGRFFLGQEDVGGGAVGVRFDGFVSRFDSNH